MRADLPTDPGPGDEQQRALYGESWAGRLGRLMAAYGLSQARLAGVIGLSAPMLSQLVTGHRVKISNPSVFGRIVRLEELMAGDLRRHLATLAEPAQLAAAAVAAEAAGARALAEVLRNAAR